MAALEGTVLDGEIIFTGKGDGGGRSKFVTSVMGSLPAEAIRKQEERGWLQYVVFDCLCFKGQDVRSYRLEERTALARVAMEIWRSAHASMAGQVRQHKRQFCDYILESGGEGVILKRLDHRYGDKRGWVKVKAEATADCVIIGYKSAKEMSTKTDGVESMTKYAKAGLIGALVVGQSEVATTRHGREGMREVATVSGFPDSLRADLTYEPAKYLGAVIRIKHNGREPTGRFRHPRFDGFRPDKNARDCVFDLGEK